MKYQGKARTNCMEADIEMDSNGEVTIGEPHERTDEGNAFALCDEDVLSIYLKDVETGAYVGGLDATIMAVNELPGSVADPYEEGYPCGMWAYTEVLTSSYMDADRIIDILAVSVEEPYRHRGIGTALMKNAEFIYKQFANTNGYIPGFVEDVVLVDAVVPFNANPGAYGNPAVLWGQMVGQMSEEGRLGVGTDTDASLAPYFQKAGIPFSHRLGRYVLSTLHEVHPRH